MYTAVILTLAVAAVTIGGLQSIASVASKIVPAMAVIYFVATVGFLLMFIDKVPAAVMEVLRCAFTPTAAAGGFAGASVMLAMRSGVARGVFSNESGLGSAPIVAAAAKTKWPAEQGLVSMTGTFIDTIIICTLTGLTLVVSGLWKGDLNGAALTQAAFMQGYPEAGKIVLMVGLVLFAFTTILGWNYYGERCIVYLAGVKAILPYRLIFIVLVAVGAFLKLEAIWVLADIVNGLMAIPNLIALLALSGVVVGETKRYFKHVEQGDVDEVNGLLPDGPEEVIEQKLEGR
jgi:AGCS family alanine or glycine:cation symporter